MTDDPLAVGRGRRILVVDDEEAIVHTTSRFFVAHGYVVDAAREREEAEALLSTSRYALVIADMRLTGVHGREGLELIGFVRERCPWAKVIVLTGYVSDDLAEEAQRRGADLFLEKPVPLPDLLAMAGRLIGGTP